MKNLILFTATLLIGSSSFASEACSNFAKYAAIKAYKAEVGTVQGSNGIQYSAELTDKRGDDLDFLVKISDNNEDGEAWTVDYVVNIRKNGEACEIMSVRSIAE